MRIIAGLMALALSGCSFFAYGRPVVVHPPGTRDPATAVGASVRCYRKGWPITADAVAAGASFSYAGSVVLGLVQAITGEDPELEPEMLALFLPSVVLLTSAVYGGNRVHECGRAVQASARAKLRGEPLRIEDGWYEEKAPEPARDREPPPAGSPSTTAPLPQP